MDVGDWETAMVMFGVEGSEPGKNNENGSYIINLTRLVPSIGSFSQACFSIVLLYYCKFLKICPLQANALPPL